MHLTESYSNFNFFGGGLTTSQQSLFINALYTRQKITLMFLNLVFEDWVKMILSLELFSFFHLKNK